MKKLPVLIAALLVLAGGVYFQFFKESQKEEEKAAAGTEAIIMAEEEKPVLWSKEADQAVTEYLLSQKEFAWQVGIGSRNICVFQNLMPEQALFPVYIWIRCGEFIKTNGELKELSGTSLPVKINYPNELSYFDMAKFSYERPGDGSLYDRDVKKIFPAQIQERLHFDSQPLNRMIWAKAEAEL